MENGYHNLDQRKETGVRTRTVIEGNAFYEIDEECVRRRREAEEKRETERKQIQQFPILPIR